MNDEQKIKDWVISQIDMNYAFPKGKEDDFYSKRKEFLDSVIRSDDDLINGLKIFENNHLYGHFGEESNLKDFDQNCVSYKDGVLKIHSFWCQKSAKEDPSTTKINFFETFSIALEQLISDKQFATENQITIDLRENGGGGDEEMEFALYPFIEEKELIYFYQFKLASSPHWLPRIVSKIYKLFTNEESFIDLFDKQRRYFYTYSFNGSSKDYEKKMNEMKAQIQLKKNLSCKILVDSSTGSASELYASILKDILGADIVGGPTKKSVGAPIHKILKQGDRTFHLFIPSVRVWSKKGEFLEGRGL